MRSMNSSLDHAQHTPHADNDIDIFDPRLDNTSEILSKLHMKQLCMHLPAKVYGRKWVLMFSTSNDGYSLHSLYRKISGIDSPVLLVIKDQKNNIFGALTSCTLKISKQFYGTGESLLFRFAPEFQTYTWTGINMYFMQGDINNFRIGAGNGRFGLSLDADLYNGRTEPCATYGNEPLTSSQDFIIKSLECWIFVTTDLY